MVFTDSTPLNAPIGNVTFAPGARNNWRSHKVGQVVLVTGGEGWYQEEGKPAQLLKTGDVVNIAPNVKHWHGATLGMVVYSIIFTSKNPELGGS